MIPPIRTTLMLAAALLTLAVLGSVARLEGDRLEGDTWSVHLLNRTTFSPTERDLQELRQRGEREWLRRQLSPPAGGADPALEPQLRQYSLYGKSPREVFLYVYDRDYSLNPDGTRQVDDLRVLDQLTEWRLLRASASDFALREAMVDFWINHFNVFWDKGAELQYAMPDYVDRVVRPHALGRFRDLLGGVARSVPMMAYLDNATSSAHAEGGPNENYARELMELHTLGVDGGYTQQDVREVAWCFTGWTIVGIHGTHRHPRLLEFEFDPTKHAYRPKLVLGEVIPGFGGVEDGELVLDLLARHPSTARRLCRKLAARFVCDAPPEDLVERLSSVYLRTDGNVGRVMEALLTDPEFRRRQHFLAKAKTPFEVVAGTMRALEVSVVPGTVDNNFYEGQTRGADLARSRPPLEPSEAIRRMGAPMFEWLTPDGPPDRFEAWTHPAAMLERLQFADQAAGLYGATLVRRRGLADGPAVVRWLLPGRRDLESGLPQAAVPAVGAVLASPEFQRR